MSDYTRAVLRVVVAQICQTIGWHSINSTPLEFLVDLMQEYFTKTYRLSHQYAEILGRTEVNLDDLGLAFQQMNVDLQQLSEYVKNVESVPCVIPVPKYPLPRENHLNFLKPGSREVVTRPIHIHDYLPAMYPEIEELPDENTPDNSIIEIDTADDNLSVINSDIQRANETSPENIFKRPGDPLPDSPNVKRAKFSDESRPLREIHSVMMTTSGFLSPAREGKLPEAKTPIQARPDTPPPTPPPTSPPTPPPASLPSAQLSQSTDATSILSPYPTIQQDNKTDKKSKKIVKKSLEDRKLDKENKKKNRDKDSLFKPDKVKKLTGVKETGKLKALKSGGVKGIVSDIPSSTSPIPPINTLQKNDTTKLPKNQKIKSEKFVTNIVDKKDDIDKLPSAPDKQKLNIFKKISKTKDDKLSDTVDHHKYKDQIKRENSPSIMMDNNIDDKINRNDITIKKEDKKVPRTPDVNMHNNNNDGGYMNDLRSPSSDVYMFDDNMSPPGTPSTPKTPELSVPVPDVKKKKKETRGRKKGSFKKPPFADSPQKIKMPHEMIDTSFLGRPKTPEAIGTLNHKDMNLPPTVPFPFFPNFAPGPGLIPTPHPYFPPQMLSRFPMHHVPPRGIPNISPLHNLPLDPRFMPPPPPSAPAVKIEDYLAPKFKQFESPVLHPEPIPNVNNYSRNDVTVKPEKIGKTPKQDKITISPVPKTPKFDSYGMSAPAPAAPPQESPIQKLERAEKLEKKSKKHKIDKKDKLKKKKDKKDKHKEKPEKNKEKKEKLDKIKEKKEKKEKKKDLMLKKEEKKVETIPKLTVKFSARSPRPPTPENLLTKKLTIKAPKKPVEVKRESSPELVKISAFVTNPPKQKPPKVKTEPVVKKEDPKDNVKRGYLEPQPPSFIIDEHGKQIWICPACHGPDDETPMIGCDTCDAWYHWVCVGIQVAPADDENWYCRYCIIKKEEIYHDKKKKKRKKKGKVDD